MWRVWRVKRRAGRISHGEIEVPLLPFLVPARVSVDVGANKGALTYILAQYSARVVAYEANPNLFKKLQQALGSRVDLRHKAAGKEKGVLTFFVPTSQQGRELPNIGSLKENSAYSSKHYHVDCVRLDDEQLADVGFIKIDVEGTELDVLQGALGVIARDRPVLMIEINDKMTDDAQEIERLLKMMAYQIVDFSQKTMRLVEHVQDVDNRNVFFMPLKKTQ